VSLDFTKCATEYALYSNRRRARLIVGVYVKDLIITGTEWRDINNFKREMKALFRMSDLSLLTYYLSIEVEQGRDAMMLRQSSYAQKLVE
jgi:hypothetical protein